MNREETLALFGQGKDAWNKWAQETLTEKEKLKEAGEWSVMGVGGWGEAQNERTKMWFEAAIADFGGYVFKQEADFSGFIFPSDAIFEKVRFEQIAIFKDAHFKGQAGFWIAHFAKDAVFEKAKFNEGIGAASAIFEGYAEFRKVHFSGSAAFSKTTFKDGVGFGETLFEGGAGFGETHFEWRAWFGKTIFKEEVWFDKVHFIGEARFDEAIFEEMAVFTEAKFQEDARFDDACFIGNALFFSTEFRGYSRFTEAEFQQEADFRSILATSIFTIDAILFHEVPDFRQAHFTEAPDLTDIIIKKSDEDMDAAAKYCALKKLAIEGHDHEQELKYFAGELKSNGSFIGKLYGLFSDYGRSVCKPLYFWLITTLYAYTGYFYFSLSHERQPTAQCDKLLNAFELALRKGLLVLGWEKSSRLDQIYGCLYGMTQHGKPAIPDAVSFVGLAQTVWSAVFIFLLLLSLRNRFRIK